MKIRSNWRFWGLVFLFFVGVWFWRASTVSYYKATPLRAPMSAPAPDIGERMPDRGTSHPPPPPPGRPSAQMTTPKEPTDVWGWAVKIGGALTGLKTLLDIVDKLKSKAPQPVPVSGAAPIQIPAQRGDTIIIVIKRLASLVSPMRLFRK